MGKQRMSFGLVLLFGLLVVTAGIFFYSKMSYTGFAVENTCINSTTNCTETWDCTGWGECADGTKTRTCTDTGACGTTNCKPEETQECSEEESNETVLQNETNSNETITNETEILTHCGDGEIQTPDSDNITELCDDGENNGQVCSAGYESSCIYCSSDCQTITVQGVSCGDGTCNAEFEDCIICENDCGVCEVTENTPVEEENTDTSETADVISETCTPDWQCGDWQECINETQIRICTDANSCGTIINEPAESQSCTVVENLSQSSQVNETVKESKGFLSIVGSVVKVPINFVFTNKTRTIIFSGVAVLIAGFFLFRLFLRKGRIQKSAPKENSAPKAEVIEDNEKSEDDSNTSNSI